MHCRRKLKSDSMRSTFMGFVLCLLACGGIWAGMDHFPEDLAKWVRKPPPLPYDKYYINANNDIEHEWNVTLKADRPSVELVKQRTKDAPLPFVIEPRTIKDGLGGRRSVAKVSNGWIVGFNAGEWGGAIWWFSADGKQRLKISEDQVIGFMETTAGLLAFEGIAHGTISRGKILRLSQGPDQAWHVEHFLDLKGAPVAAVKSPEGAVLVATFDRLLRVDPKTKTMEVLVKDAFWGGLYPNSMVCTRSGTITLGMRHGVAEVAKVGTDWKVTWLVPNLEYEQAFENLKPGFR